MARATMISLTAIIALAAVARAQSAATATDHFQRGVRSYETGEYADAALAFSSAYELDPQASTLYAWAQAERRADNCAKAVALYRDFLALNPSDADAHVAQSGLDSCEKTLAAKAEVAESVTEPVAEQAVIVAPAEPDNDIATHDDARHYARDPWYSDKLGGGLAAAGVVALGVGTGYLLSSRSQLEDLRTATGYEQFSETMDSARTRRKIGVWGVGIGGVLVAGAVARYLWPARRERRAGQPDVQVHGGPDSVGVAVGFDF